MQNQINIDLEKQIAKFYKLGKEAKRLQYQMYKICSQLKPIENELKYHFPFISELYDNLIRTYDKKSNI